MNIAYLILAHDQPAHLRELIGRLSSPDSHFYVHIDRKSRLADFNLPDDPRIHILQDRVRVFWGDYSQVEAILRLMRAALADSGFSAQRLVLLSGADYPVHNNADIHAHFQSHADCEFINLVQMPSVEKNKPLSLLTTYRPGNTSSRLVNRLLQAVQRIGLLPRQRDFVPVLGGLQPYGGSTWWALTRPAAAHIVNFMDAHPEYADFFRHTICPDESCFHTILGNSVYAAQVRPCLTYADWSRKLHRPETLTLAHAAFLTGDPMHPEGQPYLFARKFAAESQDLLRVLRAHLDDAALTHQATLQAQHRPQRVPSPVSALSG